MLTINIFDYIQTFLHTSSRDLISREENIGRSGGPSNSGVQAVNVPGCALDRIGSFATHPTYVTGKLKDIHKYVFQLRPMVREHQFSAMSISDDVNADSPIDQNFDSIIIKIYGRAYNTNVPLTDRVLTRLHSHVISNQELQFDESVPLSRYSTNCKYVAGEVETMKRANTQYPKAAYISKIRN